MTFDDQLRRVFDTLTERLHDDVRREVQTAVDSLAVDSAAHKASPATDMSAGRLVDAVRSMARARSLSETLDTLATCAALEADRAAVLTVRGGRVHGWRFVGFGPLDHDPPVNVWFDAAGIIASAVRANAVTSGQPAPSFTDLPPDASCIALPIALADEVVAVLYAEATASGADSRVANADALEILARYAARAIEAVTAFKVARSLTAGTTPSEKTTDTAADDDETSARRYARLLVSEIKLYHEDSVVAGRKERDLNVRLGGEIAHARVLYEQRIPPHVRHRASYFDEELVRTLADGDASLLELRT